MNAKIKCFVIIHVQGTRLQHLMFWLVRWSQPGRYYPDVKLCKVILPISRKENMENCLLIGI